MFMFLKHSYYTCTTLQLIVKIIHRNFGCILHLCKLHLKRSQWYSAILLFWNLPRISSKNVC